MNETDIDRSYPRDLVGYAGQPPHAQWPGSARIAVQFVINYEEGAENNILHGDAASEAFLSEMVGTDAREGVRHMSMEWLYEYGSRAGFWRLLRLFTERELTATVFAVGMALERNPQAAQAMVDAGFENIEMHRVGLKDGFVGTLAMIGTKPLL